jgi:N-acetylmuramic acid 6-phosphate etherase
VRPEDIVIGVTVSGTTPYVEGALGSARQAGATTALITSNPAAPLAALADHVLVAETGPEVLTGSTRLKAGTATKILLNGFSTALMVRMGLAYSNLMVSVLATNHKLRERTLRILGELTGGDRARDIALLDEAGGDLRVAVVSVVAGTSAAQAREALGLSGGSVPAAVRALAGSQP